MLPIFIPTRGRPNRQTTLNSIPYKYQSNVTLVTSKEEMLELRWAIGKGCNAKILADDTTNLSDRRQFIQEYAVGKGMDKIIMMDDDLGFLKKGPKKDPEAKTPYSMHSITPKDFNIMMCEMSDVLNDHAIASFAERNRCHTYVPDELDLSYNGRLMLVLAYRTDVVAREGFRWDEFRLCADFDMTLNLYRAGYSGASICRYIVGQRMSNDDGGCSNYRTKKLHESVIEGLIEKHAPFVTMVERETKGGWYEDGKRKEVKVAWKKAWASAKKRKIP